MFKIPEAQLMINVDEPDCTGFFFLLLFDMAIVELESLQIFMYNNQMYQIDCMFCFFNMHRRLFITEKREEEEKKTKKEKYNYVPAVIYKSMSTKT